MICSYIRSSALGSLKYCEQSYFLTYNLGLDNPPNKKTCFGSIAHKVWELLSVGKKYIQDNPKCKKIKINDDTLGKLEYTLSDWNEKRQLSELEIVKINSSRVNKEVYKYDVSLKGDVWRTGEKVIQDMIDRTIPLYKDDSWQPIDIKHVNNFVWMETEYENGLYDPRNLKIVSPEQHFDFTLEREWSWYEFEFDGKIVSGHLAIKGTIDLITELDSDTLEIIDFKSGSRLDWGTGEVKTYDMLQKDPQLMLYYYAATRLYPGKNIIITIFFVRDGGPFTICFEPHHLDVVEETLKKHYLEVSANQNPKLRSLRQTDFQCTKLCNFYKNNQPGSHKNICRFIHDEIEAIGMDEVIDKYKNKGFDPNKYDAPGEI